MTKGSWREIKGSQQDAALEGCQDWRMERGKEWHIKGTSKPLQLAGHHGLKGMVRKANAERCSIDENNNTRLGPSIQY